MQNIFLSIGSNLGNKIENIEKAISYLYDSENILIKNKSSFYETEPVGIKNQPNFINLVLELETKLGPLDLLKVCKEVEYLVGRKLRKKWEEREIDIDIIFYDKEIIVSDILQVPHHELYNRRFVLIPLNEISSNFICPRSNKSIESLLSECHDSGVVKMINNHFSGVV